MTEHHLEFLSLKGGWSGSSESTLVKMPHCCKTIVTAHMILHKCFPILLLLELIKNRIATSTRWRKEKVDLTLPSKLIDPISIWALTRENLLSEFANNKGTDQSAHPCRLISTFVVHLLESIVPKLATSEISIF